MKSGSRASLAVTRLAAQQNRRDVRPKRYVGGVVLFPSADPDLELGFLQARAGDVRIDLLPSGVRHDPDGRGDDVLGSPVGIWRERGAGRI